MTNKKKFRVWTHYDTGVEQVIEAKDKDEAVEIAEDNLDNAWEVDSQIEGNLQMGESDATEIKQKKGKTHGGKKNEQRTRR